MSILCNVPALNRIQLKGGLISEGVLTLVPMPKKGAKSLMPSKKFEKVVYCKRWKIKTFCSGDKFVTFSWQWEQSKNTPEILLPLATDIYFQGVISCH